jgi:hypothetical protein
MKKMAIENKGVFVRQAVDFSENRGFCSRINDTLYKVD